MNTPSNAGVGERTDIKVDEATATSVFQWLKSGEAVLVDVRETEEYASEHVSGSILSPLSMFDADLFPKFGGKRVVMLCAIGKRSAAAAKQLVKVGYGDVVNLTGGLEAWKQAGCPTSAGI